MLVTWFAFLLDYIMKKQSIEKLTHANTNYVRKVDLDTINDNVATVGRQITDTVSQLHVVSVDKIQTYNNSVLAYNTYKD